MSRPSLARRRVVAVARRGHSVLLCNGAHVGPHVWPTGEEVDDAGAHGNAAANDLAPEIRNDPSAPTEGSAPESRADSGTDSTAEWPPSRGVPAPSTPGVASESLATEVTAVEPPVLSRALALLPEAIPAVMLPRPSSNAAPNQLPATKEGAGPERSAEPSETRPTKVTVELNVQTTLRFTVELPSGTPLSAEQRDRDYPPDVAPHRPDESDAETGGKE